MRRTRFALVAFLAAVMAALMSASLAAAQDPVAGDFEKVTLDDDTQNPMELDVAPDGRVFYIERDGRVQIWSPVTQQTVDRRARSRSRRARRTACSASSWRPTSTPAGRVYLCYSQLPDSSEHAGRLALQGQRQLARHAAPSSASSPGSTRPPSAATPPARCTSTAPATSTSRPATTRTRSPPTASRRSTSGPAASSGTPSARRRNTNDLNGKIMRITPLGEPDRHARRRHHVHDPGRQPVRGRHGEDAARDLRHGLPQPVPVHGRPGDGLGPDGRLRPGRRLDGRRTAARRAASSSTRSRRPATTAGPTASARTSPYNDYDFATGQSGPKFNCATPVNNSPNNTGLTNLPPAGPRRRGRATPRPTRGSRGSAPAAPRWAARATTTTRATRSPTKFPAFYDDKWFIAEWNNGWIKTATLDATARRRRPVPVPRRGRCNARSPAPGCYKRPMDFDFGPDGSLYVIEWGSGFGGNNADSGIYRIDYTRRRPPAGRARRRATPDNGPAPLDGAVLQRGLERPRGHDAHLRVGLRQQRHRPTRRRPTRPTRTRRPATTPPS